MLTVLRTRIWERGLAGKPGRGEVACVFVSITGAGEVYRKCERREHRTQRSLPEILG